MQELRFIASVTERDIDFLLLEELTVNQTFQRWFQQRVAQAFTYQAPLGVWHSVVDAELGESDLVFIYGSATGERMAILIENKINAEPQPEQAKRYRARGIRGVKSGRWDCFSTCVVAPERYLASSKHSQGYDVEVAYEEVLAFFAEQGSEDRRSAYKAELLNEAIEQNRRGYQAAQCPAMTAFVADYYAVAHERFPQLMMQEPRPRPSGSTWISFSPAVLPREGMLYHQLCAGAVKLFLSAPHTLESVTAAYAMHLTKDTSLEQAGKSVALILHVPKIDPWRLTVTQQQEAVVIGLQAVAALLTLIHRVAAESQSGVHTAAASTSTATSRHLLDAHR